MAKYTVIRELKNAQGDIHEEKFNTLSEANDYAFSSWIKLTKQEQKKNSIEVYSDGDTNDTALFNSENYTILTKLERDLYHDLTELEQISRFDDMDDIQDAYQNHHSYKQDLNIYELIKNIQTNLDNIDKRILLMTN